MASPRFDSHSRKIPIQKVKSKRFGIKVIDCVNSGNHSHLIVKLSNRFTYSPFIRALTGAICLKVGGKDTGKFWDFRTNTRIVVGWKGLLKARDYLAINRVAALTLESNLSLDSTVREW